MEQVKIYMPKEDALTIIEHVKKSIAKIEKGYLSIAGDVAKLRDGQAWKKTGHKNLYDLCADCFGMSRGTVSNMCHVYDRFGNGDYKLEKEAGEKKLTELLIIIKEEKQAEKGQAPEKEQEPEQEKRKSKVYSTEYTTIEPENLSEIMRDLLYDLRASTFKDNTVPEGSTIEIIVKR